MNGKATLLCYISLFSGYLGDTEVERQKSTVSLLDRSLKSDKYHLHHCLTMQQKSKR